MTGLACQDRINKMLPHGFVNADDPKETRAVKSAVKLSASSVVAGFCVKRALVFVHPVVRLPHERVEVGAVNGEAEAAGDGNAPGAASLPIRRKRLQPVQSAAVSVQPSKSSLTEKEPTSTSPVPSAKNIAYANRHPANDRMTTKLARIHLSTCFMRRPPCFTLLTNILSHRTCFCNIFLQNAGTFSASAWAYPLAEFFIFSINLAKDNGATFMMLDDGKCIVFDNDADLQEMTIDNYTLIKKVARRVEYQYLLNMNYTVIQF